MEKNLIIDPNYEIIGGKEHHQLILSRDLLTAVTSGNGVDVKRMIEDGECLDQQDEEELSAGFFCEHLQNRIVD